jgi:hypothetical protein
MQDTEMFLSLAEIAGVFVGFGALISVRSGGASDAHEVSYIRRVVSGAIWVVIAALAPVIVSRYDISGHEVWLVCSLLALVLWFGVWIVNERTPEMRKDVAATPRAVIVREMTANLLLFVPMMIALVLVVLGLFPDQEPALYLTAVGLILFLDALTLLFLVFSQGRPQTASHPTPLPATGGSSA